MEILFDEIRKHFSSDIQPTICIASWESTGIIKRLKIGLEALKRQEKNSINHVTGDINFLPLFLKKNKTVSTILDVGFMNHPNPIAKQILKLFWIKAAVYRSKVVTTISQATKNELLKHVHCDPNKIKVVYVPVSSNYKPTETKFNDKCPTILQIGTKPNKNVPRLIAALEGIDCQLDIVGDLTEEMITMLKKHKIKFVNSSRIPEKVLIEKYQTCDIVSFISTYEGFGMPIVEANMIGKPVITSNLLSMPEVAGGSAHLVDPYNIPEIKMGLLKLIQNPTYRNQLVSIGRENYHRFSAKNIATQLEEIYSTILTEK